MAENERKILLAIREKIINGLPLAFERMWADAKITNRELVVVKNDKIISVRARDYNG